MKTKIKPKGKPQKGYVFCPECGKEVQIINGRYELLCHKNFCSKAGEFANLINETEKKKEIEESKEISIFTPEEEQTPEISLDPDIFTRIPYPYQEKVNKWSFNLDKVPLFIEMRLGKTPMTIWWAKDKIKKSKKPLRILVLAPKTVVQVWVNQLSEEGITPVVLNTSNVKALDFVIKQMPGWFVTNYETVTFSEKHTATWGLDKNGKKYKIEEGDGISKYDWDMVIIDESTKLKDPRTQISKLCVDDFDEVPMKAILTGTPAPENILNYFQQLKFMFGGQICGCDTFEEFKNKYFYMVAPNKYEPLPGFKEYLSLEIGKVSYVLKRDQVGRGSKKQKSPIYVEMEGEYLNEYKTFESQWLNKEFETKWAIVAFNYLARFASGYPKDHNIFSTHKLDALIDMREDEQLYKEKIITWCNGTREVDALYNKYFEIGRKVKYIDGRVPEMKRHEYIKMLGEGDITDLVCQVKTAQMGLDISCADTAMYFSNSTSALSRMQSEDRVIHPEKQCPVLLIDFITKNSFDEDVYEALNAKIEGQEGFLQLVYQNMCRRLGRAA